jgi:signal transduction histidine kinase
LTRWSRASGVGDTAVVDVREIALRIGREPRSRRALRELCYLVVVLPLTVLGVLYAVVSLLVGTALAITAIGIPLISRAVPGARWFGARRRWLTNRLLDARISAPPPFRPPRGFLARVSAGLRDRVGWRTVAYLLLTLPVDAAGGYVLLVSWGWGLIALLAPIEYPLGLNTSTVDGREVFVVHGIRATTWAGTLPILLVGVAWLLLAPWVVRAWVLLDATLARSMIGGGASVAERIRDLERSRAYAIEDAAGTLRRIERDLHDGVQARMVALAMNLTMLNETLGDDVAAQSRELLTAALDHAKDGIAELRQMVVGIHPPALDAGLETALSTLAARSPIPVAVHAELPDRPTEAIETIAYFSVAELLTNVTKHSGAERAEVELTESADRLVLTVRDDGHGGANVDGTGSGLRGLTERIGTVDGSLAVDSPAGGPTVVTVELPLHVGG